MEPTTPLERDLRYEERATDLVVRYLADTKDEGRLVYPLVEIAEETALDPTTAEAVMTRLQGEGPFTVRRQGGHSGETRWLVRGSAFDVEQQRHH